MEIKISGRIFQRYKKPKLPNDTKSPIKFLEPAQTTPSSGFIGGDGYPIRPHGGKCGKKTI